MHMQHTKYKPYIYKKIFIHIDIFVNVPAIKERLEIHYGLGPNYPFRSTLSFSVGIDTNLQN